MIKNRALIYQTIVSQYLLRFLSSSELLENPKEIFLQYYMHSNMLSMLSNLQPHYYITSREIVKLMTSALSMCYCHVDEAEAMTID